MKFLSATAALLLFAATGVVAAPAGISVNVSVLRQLINTENQLLNQGREIANRLQSTLSTIDSAFQGSGANAIRAAQQAAVNYQQQANQGMAKVIDALNRAVKTTS
ncbi:hypothetical protein LPJ60_005401 [Coemansia sp. RSA 2675]|nr:hypothetical protein LPJ60_005401 [Coemansia sp. RSA 2675]